MKFSSLRIQQSCFYETFSSGYPKVLQQPGPRQIMKYFLVESFSSVSCMFVHFSVHVAENPGSYTSNVSHLRPESLIDHWNDQFKPNLNDWALASCQTSSCRHNSFTVKTVLTTTQLQIKLIRIYPLKSSYWNVLHHSNYKDWIHIYVCIFLFKMCFVSEMNFHTRHISRITNLFL